MAYIIDPEAISVFQEATSSLLPKPEEASRCLYRPFRGPWRLATTQIFGPLKLMTTSVLKNTIPPTQRILHNDKMHPCHK